MRKKSHVHICTENAKTKNGKKGEKEIKKNRSKDQKKTIWIIILYEQMQ